MNTPTKKYKDSLKTTPGPVSLSDSRYTCDIPGIFRYAQEKGVNPSDLSEEEKSRFLTPKK